MNKLAIVATIKIAPGRRDEYLKPLQAHAKRCLANDKPSVLPITRCASWR